MCFTEEIELKEILSFCKTCMTATKINSLPTANVHEAGTQRLTNMTNRISFSNGLTNKHYNA